MAGKASVAVDFPPEIISEIFIHCLPRISSQNVNGLHAFQPQVAFDPCNAPLLLTRVCRRWRLIAEATPALWTRLPTTRSAKALELYKMFIKNSGEAPLWTHLTSDDAGREVDDILTAHSHRWEHLTLTFHARFDDLPNQLPSLKHLQLRQTRPSYHEPDLYRLPEFQAPLLRRVQVSMSRVLGLNLPWSQLTHYSGEINLLQDAQAFLSLCPNLEVLHLLNPRQTIDLPRAPRSPIHLPRLHDLLLINLHLFSYYHFLIDSLVLPVLETVCVSLDHDYPIVDALCQCVVRSSSGGVPRLRSVEIQCSRILNQSDLQELSRMIPGIQELKIRRPSPDALVAMTFHPTDPILFPCLRRLTLVDPLLGDYELVDIVISRCHPPPSDLDSRIKLRRVEVMFVGESTPAILAMSRRGMDQPLHEEFQDVAECFTDDPSFRQMCEELTSILTVRTISHSSQKYELPSHWGQSMGPLQCFFEFSDAVFTFFEKYEVHHPLLLSRHQVAPLLREFVRGHLGADGLLRTHSHGFLDRAGALLDQWQPMIDEYSKQERWVVEEVDRAYSLVRQAGAYTHKVVYCTSS